MQVGEAVRLRILELCQQKNITVNKLATLCGLTQSTLSNIINGRNKSTTVATVKKLCDGLDLNLVDFFSSSLFEHLEQEVR